MARPQLPEGSLYVRHSQDFAMRKAFLAATGRSLPDAVSAFYNLLILDLSADPEALLFSRGFLAGSDHENREMLNAS